MDEGNPKWKCIPALHKALRTMSSFPNVPKRNTMSARFVAHACLSFALFAGVIGCEKPAATEGGPLRAGPYPESRNIIEWLRIKNHDPDITVVKWVERREVPRGSSSDEEGHVNIVIHYRTTRDNVNGVWTQTLRVQDKRITAEADPVAVE
jgi:hypothetical protein